MTQMGLLKDSDYYYEEVEIKDVEALLNAGINVEVDSPSGFTKVVRYVEKGIKKLFIIECNNKKIRVSYDHLFETCDGWVPAWRLNEQLHTILCKDGKFHDIKVHDCEDVEDVVDLEVANESHKYYTEDMVSHNTNVGKTLIMCSLATNMIMQGKNVLYVTFEDSEDKIANRIMFNLMDADKAQLRTMSKEAFMRRFEAIKKVVKQKLIIKEFPEYTICANHLRQLFKDLKQKKKFVPEIMFIDYIGCMMPNGKQNSNLNSNDVLRLVAGQTRAIGMEYSIPVVSGAQTNRGGSTASEIDLTDTADSFGQTTKADVIFGVTETPELAAAGMFTFFLLKSRYGLKGMKISVGCDKFKQRLFNIVDGEEDQKPRPKNLVDEAVVNILKNGKSVKNIAFE
jgi:1,2-phenylacetyl-CoA epoxidase PaaB subunit